ncbi:MAG: phenylalanine--tRNA ligase subunit alpha [Simkaniaceae bacterium]|nr:phenylalanine--tRNA ligase subunit alpha [Simkaniaceae bacterium]
MTSKISEKIEELRQAFKLDLVGCSLSRDLQELKVKFLGRKGPIQALMQELKECPADQRPQMGQSINQLKDFISSELESKIEQTEAQELQNKLSHERVDVTLPGRRPLLGKKHPVIQMLDEVIEVAISMGFSVEYSSELETEYYCYGGLNFPPDHPARDMQDTFYVTDDLLLRSHTTSIQQHLFENLTPPIRVIAPGKCYRNEAISARSHVFFHQVDAIYIDKNVTFADLLATKEAFYSKLFNQQVELRVRPSYFPFVEPGMEVDIRCTECGGKGCRLCKQTGWLEVCGAGMVHPEVLKAGGLDPEVYSGYAWGGGIERLALLKYGIPDIRILSENDLRFLSQFP